MNEFAVITGGANGIGRAVCLRLAAAGISVAIVDREEDDAERVKQEILAAGGEAEARLVDVTNAGQVKEAVAELSRRYGHVDILANIAGGSFYTKRVEELAWAEWKEVVDANLKGTFLFCREVAPIMSAQKRGRIVNTASNYALTGSAMRTAYSAAKAAIIGFSKSLAMELAPCGVLVNVIAPGPTDTPRVLQKSTPEARQRWAQQIPMGRTAQPEDIAEGVYFLVGPESAYMTGQTLHVNGGVVTP